MPAASKASFCSLAKSSPFAARARRSSASLLIACSASSAFAFSAASLAFFSSSVSFWSFSSSSLASASACLVRGTNKRSTLIARRSPDAPCNTSRSPLPERWPLPSDLALQFVAQHLHLDELQGSAYCGVLSSPSFFAASDIAINRGRRPASCRFNCGVTFGEPGLRPAVQTQLW